ncbi:12448_t:CDS:2, partial [Dentiscutata heterogama]
MTALRHAFEAKSTTGLFLKISKGIYPPIPSLYSKNLRKLVSSLLKISPNDRPSVEDILKLNFLKNHIERVTKKLGLTLSCQDTSSQKLSVDHQSQCEENTDTSLSNSRLIDNFFKEIGFNPVSRVSYGKIYQEKRRQKPAEMNLNALSSEGKSQETQVSSNVKKSENHKNIQKPQNVVHKSHVKEEFIRKSLAKSVKVITNHNDGSTETGETKNNNLKNSPQHNGTVESSVNSNNVDNISPSNDEIDIIRNSYFCSEKTTNETRKPSQTSNIRKINDSSVKYSHASKCIACSLKKVDNSNAIYNSNSSNVDTNRKVSRNFNNSKKFAIKQKPMIQNDKVCVLSKKPSSSSSPIKIDSQSHKVTSEIIKNSSTTIKQAVSVPTNNASNAPNTLPLPTPPLSPSKKVNSSNNEDNIMPPKITITSSSLLYSIASKDTKKKSWDTPFSLIEGLKQDLEHLLGFDKFNQCYKLLILHQKKQKIGDENQNQSRKIIREKIIEAKLNLLLNGRSQPNYIPILKEL